MMESKKLMMNNEMQLECAAQYLSEKQRKFLLKNENEWQSETKTSLTHFWILEGLKK